MTGDNNGILVVWKVVYGRRGRELIRLEPQKLCFGHPEPIVDVGFVTSEWGNEMAISLSNEGTIGVWTLRDGQCLRMKRICSAPSDTKTFMFRSIRTIGGTNIAIIFGLLPSIEFVDINTLTRLVNVEVDNFGEWVLDVLTLPSGENDRTKSSFPSKSATNDILVLTGAAKMHLFVCSDDVGSTSKLVWQLRSWNICWPVKPIKFLGPVDTLPRQFCLSADGLKLAIIGPSCWGLLDLAMLKKMSTLNAGNVDSPVIFPRICTHDHGDEMQTCCNNAECFLWVAASFAKQNILALWSACGNCCLYSILDDINGYKPGPLLRILRDPTASSPITSLSWRTDRISHCTRYSPGTVCRSGHDNGDTNIVASVVRGALIAFKSNGRDGIHCWAVDLDILNISRNLSGLIAQEIQITRIDRQFFFKVADAFITPPYSSRCTAALVVHDHHIDIVMETPGCVIRAFEDGLIRLSSLPYDLCPLTVNCTGKESIRGVSCTSMACPTWARQQYTQGERTLATRILICGCSDGSVRVWTFTVDLSKLQLRKSPCTTANLCFSHIGHHGPVTYVSVALSREILSPKTPKEQVVYRSSSFQERTFCSVGEDRAINVYIVTLAAREHVNVERLHHLQGHPAPILAVCWQISYGRIISVCAKGETLIWGLQSGEMERHTSILPPKIPEERNSYYEPFPPGKRSYYENGAEGSIAGPTCYLLETLPKLYRPEMEIGSCIRNYKNDAACKKRTLCEKIHAAGSNYFSLSPRSNPGAESPLQIIPFRGSCTWRSRRHPRPYLFLISIQDVAKWAMSVYDRGTDAREAQTWHSDMNLALVSYLFSWGENAALDSSCLEQLGLKKPTFDITMCSSLRGKDGTLTVIPSKLTSGPRNSGEICPFISAQQSLALVSLFMSLLSSKTFQGSSQKGFFSEIITHYGVVLPEKARPRYIDPSLYFLARNGLGVGEHCYIAARLLLQGTIERMEDITRNAHAELWAKRLNDYDCEQFRVRSEITSRTSSAKAGVILKLFNKDPVVDVGNNLDNISEGLRTDLFEEYTNASGLSARHFWKTTVMIENVTLKLFERTSIYRTNSHETELGQSISMFDPHRNTIILILSVIGISFPQNVSPQTARVITSTLLFHLESGPVFMRALSAELIGKGFVLWRPHVPNLASLILTLLSMMNIARRVAFNNMSGSNGPIVEDVHVAAASRRAMLEIGASQPVLLISTVGREILRSDRTDLYYETCIMALVCVVKKRPLALSRHLSAVVEVVVKSLDPSKPLTRKGCLHASTTALHELVKRFSTVAFHQKTQRLAVGTPDKVIIIYDLRTATKWRLFEGHTGSISALSFDADGSILASYSMDEPCLKIWQVGSSGFLGGILGLNSKCLKTVSLQPLEEQVKLRDVASPCRLHWDATGEFKLRRENGYVQHFQL